MTRAERAADCVFRQVAPKPRGPHLCEPFAVSLPAAIAAAAETERYAGAAAVVAVRPPVIAVAVVVPRRVGTIVTVAVEVVVAMHAVMMAPVVVMSALGADIGRPAHFAGRFGRR